MILSAALFGLIASQQSLSFPPNFYTLESVAKNCLSQGVPVAVSTACAEDLYALRLPSVTWESLKEALERDGRLSVAARDGRWIIDRAPGSVAMERVMLRNYLQVAAWQINRVYGRAAHEYRYLQTVSPEEQTRLVNIVSSARDPDPLMSASNHLIYLSASANEIPYHDVAISARLSDPKQPIPFGTWYQSDVVRGLNLHSFEGGLERFFKWFRVDTTNMPQEALQLRAQQALFASKFSLEPFSATVTQRTTFVVSGAPYSMFSEISAHRFKIATNLATVAPADEVTRVKAREGDTLALLSGSRYSQEIEAKGRTVSSFLLSWAEKTNSQVVAYVSPLTDFAIAPEHKGSLSALLKTVNGEAFVDSSGEEYVSNVTGQASVSRKSAIKGIPKLSLVVKGDVTVVRNELRFFDTLGSAASPSMMAAQLRGGRNLPISDLVTHVSALPIRLWKSGTYPAHYQTFCNPVAFKPIAVAWQQSSEISELVKKTDLGETTSVPFSRLSAGTRNILRREMGQVAHVYEARTDVHRDPMITKSFLEQNRPGDMRLVVQRGEDWATFTILFGYQQKIWHAKIAHVTLDSSEE
jgi:hypothetical protein